MPQLLSAPELDYIVFDYLAETTMPILQRTRMRDPELGDATDFVVSAVKPNLRALIERRVRLVPNAGGLNPTKCRDAILALVAEPGLAPQVAVVTGDYVANFVAQFLDAPGEDPPVDKASQPLLSANAYLASSHMNSAGRRRTTTG